jgi:toxic protein SymE
MNAPHPARNLTVEHLSYNLEHGDSATCPFIRLKGRWLERAGFTVGSRVIVTVCRGCLVIRPLQETRFTMDNRDGRDSA